MKNKFYIVTLIALFFIVNAHSQLLWKVSGNGLSKPSYMFGTHHLIEKEQIRDFDKILTLSETTDVIVGEMDMTDMTSMQAKIIQSAMMQGKNIREMISAEDYNLVDSEFKQVLGTGLDQLGAFKPMMLETMYGVMVYLKSQNLSKQPEGVDILFQNKARENNKQVIGLETPEQQSSILFDSLPLTRQAEILVKSVKEKKKEIDLLNRLNVYYIAGDLQQLSALDKEDDDLTPEEKKPLYDNRNNNWIKQLPALMIKQSCFIAVGCMHLVGETGLIIQLKKAGYLVEGINKL